MYLLIPETSEKYEGGIIFTFHNVSINSDIPVYLAGEAGTFTFHNVSINS